MSEPGEQVPAGRTGGDPDGQPSSDQPSSDQPSSSTPPDAAEPPTDPRARQIDRIVELVLGDPPAFTRDVAASAAGLTVDQAQPYWRAMGFADVGTAPVFTATDLESLRLLVDWVDRGTLDQATTIEMVRSLGQAASRLAEWQVDTLGRVLVEAESPVDLDEVAEGMAEILPGLEALLVHAWRRHLAAVLARGLAFAADDPVGSAASTLATVGFADIAGFTRLARVMSDDDLAQMVQAFETGAADIVVGRGGRLVKTLGDEVMFVAERADDAIAIAVQMHDLTAPGAEGLNLRVGLATGHLIARMGDLYGGTVNLASRLTAMARPGVTLVDTATEDAMVDRAPYVLRHLAPRPLRGLGLVRATSVARR